jgi:hypothetical protein
VRRSLLGLGRQHLLARAAVRPDDLRAGQLVEQQIPAPLLDRRPVERQHAGEAEPGGGRGGQPGVVALRGAQGDDRVRRGGERLRAGVLQLADLVAAAPEAVQVVALEPQLGQAQARGEPWRGLQRVGQVPRETGSIIPAP